MAIPIFLTGAVSAQNESHHSLLAQRELERREASVQEGQMLLLKGDQAYEARNYKEALEAYAGASEAFPDAPATAELKAAATQRYAQSSVEYGRVLSRKGDVGGAKAVVDKVLAIGVAPNDTMAKAFRAELDDPIRTNPALTKEHGADIDQVRRLLYMAQGAFDLGKYDESRSYYEDIIRIDPFNTAARRGLELISVEKTNYYRAALDHTRAEALAEVDGGWELSLTSDLVEPEFTEFGRIDASRVSIISLSSKLQRIVIPEYRLEQGNLNDAIELLLLRAAENDTFEMDPARKGINIVVKVGDPKQSPAKEIFGKRFDLHVRNVPVTQILKYINGNTGTIYRTDDYSVKIMPTGMDTGHLILRTFRVPPDFLSNISAGAGEDNKVVDIFNSEIGKGGKLPRRMGAQEVLMQQGVTFAEGASATFSADSNTLRVVNTEANLDFIEQIIDTIAQTEPVSVAVTVKMLKIEQDRLEELGFDWMMSPFNFGGDSQSYLTGGTTGNGTPIIDINPVGAISPLSPLTAGNRSADGAIFADSIDTLISSGRGAQTASRAPGVFGLNGVFSDVTLQMLMRGLNQKKGVDLMAHPSVTTRSGQVASIYLVREFIYPTEYEAPQLPTTIGLIDDGFGGLVDNGVSNGIFPVTPATATAFEKRDVGIVMEVLPVADANRRYVDVTLNPTITDFDGFANYGTPIRISGLGPFGPVSRVVTQNAILMPIFSVRRTTSNIVVADGATIVIGGMLKEEVEDVEDKTPVLGDIPVVGRLFQSDAKRRLSTVVLFFVNVELLDPTGRPYRDR